MAMADSEVFDNVKAKQLMLLLSLCRICVTDREKNLGDFNIHN